MKIVIFGASGMIGQRILAEALHRGHQVTAVARGTSKISSDAALTVRAADIQNEEQLSDILQDQEVAINATSPGADERAVVAVANSLIKALSKKPKVRLVVVGGAGSLEVAPGLQLVDSAQFPPAWKGIALAHRDALDVYRKSDIDWTYVSPPMLIEPGDRTGTYREGADSLVTDDKGESRISAEDYAVALLDEIEEPAHRKARFTVGY